jgi:hypothetical protein
MKPQTRRCAPPHAAAGIGAHGLEIGKIARIEDSVFGAQVRAMPLVTIRNSPSVSPMRESELWRARAARARRVAAMLSRPDAEIALAHAVECEAEAERLTAAPRRPIAA